jgi:hypothetical protein
MVRFLIVRPPSLRDTIPRGGSHLRKLLVAFIGLGLLTAIAAPAFGQEKGGDTKKEKKDKKTKKSKKKTGDEKKGGA